MDNKFKHVNKITNLFVAAQREALLELVKNKCVLSDEVFVRREFCYFRVVCDSSGVVVSFEVDLKRVDRVRVFAGFFALLSFGVGFGALRVLEVYGLRDEQEKCFGQMKDQLGADRQRNWSEDGKAGRLFVLFVSLVLGSYLRFVWKSSRLCGLFSSSLEVLDEMRSVRFIEHVGFGGVVSPFVGLQLDVCDVFGFEVPVNCLSGSVLGGKVVRKRGRPSKKVISKGL
ncbi:MAG: hypothetical protein FWH37_04275 [Candidatus Bathyarchaeota archaeon]|nr:hypothetical protein [Candidatus Termiticorpusculum sp.]